MRALALFWIGLILVLASGAAILWMMGPPPIHRSRAAITRSLAPPALPPSKRPALATASLMPPASSKTPRTPAAAPYLSLLQHDPDHSDAMLPRIAANGQTPMAGYAAKPPPLHGRPAIGLVIDGIGLSDAETKAAIALPPAIDLAFSAYAPNPAAAAASARAAGHELMLSLPMEPAGYPLEDEGPRALLTNDTAAENARNLEWVLGRLQGYVGVTGASDGLRGERFGQSPSAFAPVADEIARRGLFYLDPRPGAPPPKGGLAVTEVIDRSADPEAVDAALASLEQDARRSGSAIGLAGPPVPSVLTAIAAWARELPARGLVLVPLTALLPKAPS